MNTTITEMNGQTFMPQPQNMGKASENKTSFRDVMKEVSKDDGKKTESNSSPSKPKEPPTDSEPLENENKENVSLMVQQMAAALAAPTSQVVVAAVMPGDGGEILGVQAEVQEVITPNTVLQTTVAEAQAETMMEQAATPATAEKPVQSMKELVSSPLKGETGQRDGAVEIQKPIAAEGAQTTQENGEQNKDTTHKSVESDIALPQEREEKIQETVTVQPMTVKPESTDQSKINVKVGEAPLQADSPTFSDDLAEKILYQAKDGKTQFELELNPRDLGTIRIKLVFDGGKATVLMSCSNAKTEQMLLGSAEQIRSIVQEQTGSATTVQVKEEAHQAQQDMDGHGDNQNKRRQEEEQRKQQQNNDGAVDAAVFLQQLRLGLVGKES